MQHALKKRAVGLVIVGLLCIGGPASSTADDAKVPSTASDYRIGLEDVLDISVRSNAELDKVVPVRPDGKISLPLVNDISAAGLTPMELRDALTERLAAYIQNPEVSVVVREIHSFKVSVIGNVRAPGRYDLRGASTVLDVVALAGGFTEFAARRKITILRRDGATQQRLRFDYDAAVKGDGDKNIFVKPGDIIIVP
jgi:polysaccharide export outer membrane protein